MAYLTGDIIINNAGAFGHVLMCFEGGRNPAIYHATNAKDVTTELLEQENGGTISYMFEKNYVHFTPTVPLTDNQKIMIKANAQRIQQSAVYGAYRAVRLFLSDSGFGNDAKERLAKYRGRRETTDDKLVKKVTCSEAVILAHQLSFCETDNLFIKLDAAHAMPRTLQKYLRNSAHWTRREVA